MTAVTETIEAQSESSPTMSETEPISDQSPDEKLVPVSESIRYRRRAQAAEQKLNELQAQLTEANDELSEVRDQLTNAERRSRIDQLLVASDAIDIEAARLLTEVAIEQMDEADVAEVIDDLRRHKPYLFRQRGSRGNGSLSPRPRPQGIGDSTDEAAAAASATGDRRDLLRYLRLRRQT